MDCVLVHSPGVEYTYYTYMESIYITRVVTVGTSQGIVIPAPILRGMKWERGDRLVFGFARDNQIILRKLSDKEIRELKPDISF